MLLLLWILPEVFGYECIERCDSFGRLVAPSDNDARCLISMPDNPILDKNRIRPCQIEIQSNCTDFCHVELNFAKFDLPRCSHNVSHYTDNCDQVESCEYIVLHELGEDLHGSRSRFATHFDGLRTKYRYVSLTDKILLKFCYRSETFSARNIQIEYKAIIPDSAKPLYLGPPSVYALCTVVVCLALGIAAVRWCPLLKPCLDPTPQVPRSASYNV